MNFLKQTKKYGEIGQNGIRNDLLATWKYTRRSRLVGALARSLKRRMFQRKGNPYQAACLFLKNGGGELRFSES